ncbi:hypothetical protein ANCDUO_16583 [Ancylostoma duodenale]|uniref:Uncharacterized protein n=1 Tax=Ancylostoma duodenale TaxID=51022 RepID=A0A0C2CAG4_9BILA|nr:hypothetical protein ANCDUO_16583 [Ancylostoma duodenale]
MWVNDVLDNPRRPKSKIAPTSREDIEDFYMDLEKFYREDHTFYKTSGEMSTTSIKNTIALFNIPR